MKKYIYLEDYCKWYGFWSSQGEFFPFEVLPDPPGGGSPFLDHAPNPLSLCAWAAENGYLVDRDSLGQATIRWYNEYYSDTEELAE